MQVWEQTKNQPRMDTDKHGLKPKRGSAAEGRRRNADKKPDRWRMYVEGSVMPFVKVWIHFVYEESLGFRGSSAKAETQGESFPTS
jgi:hypothetical protein